MEKKKPGRLPLINDSDFEIKAYSAKELVCMYDVSYKSFLQWLKPFKEIIGKRYGWYYSPLQVGRIIEKLGPPKFKLDN